MKKGKSKKKLALFLAFVLALSLFPGTAFAAEEPGGCTITEGCTLEEGHEGACQIPTEDNSAAAVQAMIDALPDAEDITAENAETVKAQLTEIDEAKLSLSDEQCGALDITKYVAASSALGSLNDDTIPAGNSVAMSGNAEYATLEEAFEQAPDGATIVLVDNISGLKTEDIAAVPAGKTFTLDMNGKSITVDSSFTGRPIVNNGTLTVTGNGTIDSSDSEFGGYGAINNFGTLTIENGTFRGNVMADGSAVFVRPGSEAVINGGLFEGTAAINSAGKLTVYGGTFQTTSCNRTADVNGNTYWAYCVISGGELYFYDGNVTGVQGGLAINSGYAEVKGGTFQTVACEHSPTGEASFYALYIAGEVEEVEAHISGGIYTSASRVAVVCGNDNTGGDGGQNKRATAYITGGTFTGGGTSPALQAGKNTGDPQITGGTFSSDVSQYVPAGLITNNNGDGTYTVKRLESVYLDGRNGDDSKSGSDANNAVKTLDKALQLVADNGVIYICGTVDISSDTTLDNVTFKREENFNDDVSVLFFVKSGTLNLSNVTIDGAEIELEDDNDAYLVEASSRTTVNIGEGTNLINNNGTAVAVFGNAILNMTGGLINNNHTTADGGGIYIAGGTAILSGGEISGNSAGACGGGIAIFEANVTLSGTTVKNNSADRCGGGVFIQDWDDSSSLKMTGGTITGNTYGEYYSGGGVYAYGIDTIVEITGGEISGNSCAEAGDLVGDAISLYGGDDAEYCPTLKLSGSPAISGDIFLWDAENEGPVILVTGAFTPGNPVALQANWGTEGTTVVSYSAGLIPDASQFAPVAEDMGLIQDEQDGQKLNWVEKYRVPFYDENNQNLYTAIYVMPNMTIDESLVPTPTKDGFYLVGWHPYGSEKLWNFETDVVTYGPHNLLAVWGVKQPETVSLTADHTTVHIGESIVLSASAAHEADAATYTYSWYKDGVLLNVPSSSTLTVTESGIYTVKIEAILDGMTSAAVESDPITCTVTDHVFDDQWVSDDTNHWHECAECGEKADLDAHISDGGTVTTPATETTDGMRTYTCTVCGAVLKTEVIPSAGHSHSFGNEWKYDEENHWHECACGEKADAANHTFKWVIDKEASEKEKGSKHEECSVCGYAKAAVEIPATGTTKPEDNKPDKPEDNKPGKPEDNKPAKPTDNNNSKPNANNTGVNRVKTGDTSNLILWIAILVIAGSGMTGAALYYKKHKTI